ncbi:MAG: hypothetical protein ACRC41_05090 [Sarcina sp.]
MKVKTDVIITKVEVKTKKDSTEQYIMVSFLDMLSGDVFDVLEKNIEVLSKVQAMTRRENFEVNFSNSKYGIKLDILDYGMEAKL